MNTIPQNLELGLLSRPEQVSTAAKKSTIRTSEFRIVPLRDALPPGQMAMGDCPEKIAAYWREHIQTSMTFSPTVENSAVIMLNTRRRITGHILISTGSLDACFLSPREVFLAAILANAAAIAIAHNHPSGSPEPSEADIKVTRDLMRAGQLLKIELLDHIIIGHPAEGQGFSSLRDMGYLYT